jgi:hypothetical protein
MCIYCIHIQFIPFKFIDSVVSLHCLFAVYGYSTLAVFIICLVPLIGLTIVKFQHSPAYKYILVVMLGLGVGSLAGDVFLHLIPQVSQHCYYNSCSSLYSKLLKLNSRGVTC